MEKYQIHKQVGSGAFASVSKATNRSTNEVVAIKKMKKKFSNWDECLSLTEIKSLTKLKHPNIIRLIEVVKSNDELFCVFEFAPQTLYSLYLSFKEKGAPVPEPMIKSFVYQTVLGLVYMHKNGFFHRDMKPENLLLAEGNIIKIADFGLAREIRSRPPYTEYVSTRWYRAPELLLRSQNYNSPVDIYAMGCIMAELYNQSPLFAGSSEIDQLNKICSVMGTPTQTSWADGVILANKIHYTFPQFNPLDLGNVIPSAGETALSLIRDMLSMDPFNRPTAAQILQHSYFAEVTIPQGLWDKKKDPGSETVGKKPLRFIIKEKHSPMKNAEEVGQPSRESIKTPADSPEVINPSEIFRRAKKKDDFIEETSKALITPINPKPRLIERCPVGNDNEDFEFESDKEIEREKDSDRRIEIEREIHDIRGLLAGRKPLPNSESVSLSNNVKSQFLGRTKAPQFASKEEDKEFSHSTSPVKQHEKLGNPHESSGEREENPEFLGAKSKELNLFHRKQAGASNLFQNNKFTDFKGGLDAKPKLNLPKLSPITNVKDLKEKPEYGSGPFQPDLGGSKYLPGYSDLGFGLQEDSNLSNIGFKSVLFQGGNRLPELQKLGSTKMANSSLMENPKNQGNNTRTSPNKKLVNLDPIQYSGLRDPFNN